MRAKAAIPLRARNGLHRPKRTLNCLIFLGALLSSQELLLHLCGDLSFAGAVVKSASEDRCKLPGLAQPSGTPAKRMPSMTRSRCAR